MLKNVEDISNPISKGLNTFPNYLSLEKGQSPNMMDVKVNFDGSREKRLGSNTQNTVLISASALAAFSVNVSGTLTGSLLSFWKLDEAGGDRIDPVGGVTLTTSGATLYSGGIRGQAALFNATTQQSLYAVNPPNLTANTSFSISTWFYLNSTSLTLQQTLVSKSDVPYGGIDSNCQLMLHFDGAQGSTSFPDSSQNNYSIALGGAPIVDTAQSKFGGASGKFGGTSDFLDASNAINAFQIQASNFTIDTQIRFNSVSQVNGICGANDDSTNNGWILLWKNTTGGNLVFKNVSGGTVYHDMTFAWSPVVNTWYHVAMVRSGSTWMAFVDGTTIGNLISNNSSFGIYTTQAQVGRATGEGATPSMNGWMDEFRMTKGLARYTVNFTAPTIAYVNTREMEYWLYVDTNNRVTFDVSSSGLVANASVAANSFGAVGTSTWYNAVAWLNGSNNQVGVSVNLSVNTASYTSGILTGSAPFTLGAVSNGATAFMNGRIDDTGYWRKVLSAAERSDLYNSGTGNTYSTAFDTQPWCCFDFGASSLRWLVAAAGTGLYASSNLGLTWVTIATDRTANYQYLERSKNVLVATSDAYDNNLYWAGSAGTYAAWLNSNSTASKFSINFQGFLITLNSSTRKRGFFYQDENSQLSGAWISNFDIPSSLDDEITAAFILRRYLYVSTRYKLFRINYVGGNPDWQVIELKNWGFMPRTVKRIVLTNPTPGIGLYYSVGEIAVGLTWDQKIRVFDGSNDQIISNPVEMDNGQCDYAISKISYLGSGPAISFAETDLNTNVYKLITSIGTNSTRTTHMLNYDGRAFAFYPYSRQNFNCMCMAESANRRFLMAFDRSGYCHMMDSGNLDGNTTSINEIYDSPIIFDKSPSQSTKSHRVDLFFSNTTSGQIYFQDRIDFGNNFTTRKVFTISGSAQKIIHYESIDVPETFNTYQWRITTSSGTSAPYRLLRDDYFVSGLGIGKND